MKINCKNVNQLFIQVSQAGPYVNTKTYAPDFMDQWRNVMNSGLYNII